MDPDEAAAAAVEPLVVVVLTLELLLKPPGGPLPLLSVESSLVFDADSFAALEPNLRSLFAYAKIALLNSASPNSGHMV